MLFGVLVLFMVVLGYGSVVMSGGIEPPPGSDDCLCIPPPGSPDEIKLNLKRVPVLRGIFTVSNEPCSFSSDCLEGNFVVHLSLSWGNRLVLKTFRQPNGGVCSPCAIHEDMIKGLVYDVPCFLQVEESFGLIGTPLLKDLKITTRNCIDGDPNKHIIMGEVTIAVLPPLKCSQPKAK